MSLNELRALGPSDEIQEAVESPLPGEKTTPVPGEEESGGGPPPPDMGAPPPPPSPTPSK